MQLARQTGGCVSQKTVSNILAGKSTTAGNIAALARALHVAPWRLLVDDDSEIAKLWEAHLAASQEGHDLPETGAQLGRTSSDPHSHDAKGTSEPR
jgi:hypothetical protein